MGFRPTDDPREDPTKIDWADNWLSNGLAWASYHVLPSWCQEETHWTARVESYLQTTCPCCLFWRGVVMGLTAAMVLVAVACMLGMVLIMLIAPTWW